MFYYELTSHLLLCNKGVVCISAFSGATAVEERSWFELRSVSASETASLRLRCRQGWKLLEAVKEGSVPGLAPWPVPGLFYLGSLSRFLAELFVQISSYADVSSVGSGSTVMSFSGSFLP